MSKEKWFRAYERHLAEAEERGVKHPEDVAAQQATDELVSNADFLYDWDRDERLMGNRS